MYLNQMAVNQEVVVSGAEKSFLSYGTFTKLVLSDKWDYSRTTTKYLIHFIRDFTRAGGLGSTADIRKAIASGAVEVGND
jgi:hypothetical protein